MLLGRSEFHNSGGSRLPTVSSGGPIPYYSPSPVPVKSVSETSTDVVVQEGSLALLPCRVTHVGDAMVSEMKAFCCYCTLHFQHFGFTLLYYK